MPDTDLNLLIALDALLLDASVARAARRLGLSASAMSRTLARLRDATGDALLVRAGRDMVLTPHAAGLRTRTRELVLNAQAVLRPAGDALDLAALDRTFAIRANDGFVDMFAARLIAAAAARAPRVRLRFAAKPGKTAAPLRDGAVDLEIGVLGAAGNMGPEVRVQALFRDRFVGVVRRGHPVASLPELTPAAYAALGHVVASRRGRPEGPVDEALAALGLTRRVAAIVPGFPAALAVARASDLAALLPASSVAATADVHVFALPVSTPVITVSQMWHPRLDGDPAHRWLRGVVLAACRENVGQDLMFST